MGPLTDEELLRLIALGDEDALATLYDRYAKLAYSLAFRILGDGRATEDVVQESFVNVWRRAKSFDGQRGRAKAWLLSVVHHRAIDACRRNRGETSIDALLDVMDTSSPESDVWKSVSLSLDQQAIQRALAQIPKEQRKAIHIAYFSGFTHREIAERANLPLGTVKGRIRIGMEKLRDLLKDQVVGL